MTGENLLKAVAVTAEEVAAWRHGDVPKSAPEGFGSELRRPLSPPSAGAEYLEIHVRLKPPVQNAAGSDGTSEGATAPAQNDPTADAMPAPAPVPTTHDAAVSETTVSIPDTAVSLPAGGNVENTDAQAPAAATAPPLSDIPPGLWQDLEARWKSVLGMEAMMDTLRISMESLMSEMQGSLKRTLTPEEKIYALRADVAQWNKAKSRVHHALPRVREYIHRSTWAIGAPERKQLEELNKNHIQPQIPFPEMTRVLAQIEQLLKDRQVLYAHGTAVYQECKGIANEVQSSIRTLQSNAAANAHTKKAGSAPKGKFFKSVRKWSGADG